MAAEFIGPDDKPRCAWAGAAPEFLDYHDREWGYPVDEDVRLFEKICLESFQSGLSWRTILNKREAFRAAFAGFDYRKVAEFGEEDVERLLNDAGIVRHRGKIDAVINNAGRACEMVAVEGSIAAFVWQFEPRPEDLAEPHTVSITQDSTRLSKELKSRGWKFVGPTTVYAFMQAMGLVNDHEVGCAFRETCDAARTEFVRPA